MKPNRRGLRERRRNFVWGPVALQISWRCGVGVSKRRSTWKVGQSVTQILWSRPRPRLLPLRSCAPNWSSFLRPPGIFSIQQKLYKGLWRGRGAEMSTAPIGHLRAVFACAVGIGWLPGGQGGLGSARDHPQPWPGPGLPSAAWVLCPELGPWVWPPTGHTVRGRGCSGAGAVSGAAAGQGLWEALSPRAERSLGAVGAPAALACLPRRRRLSAGPEAPRCSRRVSTNRRLPGMPPPPVSA